MMLYKKSLAFILALILAFAVLGCGEEIESTTEAESTTELEPTTEAYTTEDDSITIATGTITGQLSTPYAEEEGDELIASLIMPTIYTYDRSGDLLVHATSGKTISYNNIEYKYKTIANITAAYDATSDTSTYSITLAPGSKFSDGSSITSDDLIFTYYFLCDDSYNGKFSLKDKSIVGIKAYQLNNTLAPSIEISNEDINGALDKPTDALKLKISDEIIRPVLQEGREFCEDNWQRYVERGYGNSAQELFVMLFPQAIESEYDGDDKTFDEIFEDTVALYGMNYKAIARIYYGESDYLDDQVENLVERYIYEEKLAVIGGEEVFNISGIKKLSEDSVSISVIGKGDELKKMICDVPILSLNHYGDADSYSYDNNAFGLTRGDVSSVKSHSGSPLGYGPYTFVGIENGLVSLVPNENYTMGEVPTAKLKFINVVKADRIANLAAGNIDLAVLDLSSEEIELLKEANNGSISGDEISCTIYNDESYEYFGLNYSTLNFGESEGLYVRLALAELITAYKAQAVSKNLGDAGKVIYYPGSSSFWAVPSLGDSNYNEAFVLDEGKDVLTEARTLFESAGYTFNDDGTIKSEGLKLKTDFTFAIPSYIINDSVMMEIFEKLEDALDSMGFTISPTYFDQTDEFIIALSGKTFDVWFAERSTENLSLDKYFDTNGTNNYYGFSNAGLDELFDSMANETISKETAYTQIYKLIMDNAIEVPIYQKQIALLYDPDKIFVDEKSFTEFYTIFNDLSALHIILDN